MKPTRLVSFACLSVLLGAVSPLRSLAAERPGPHIRVEVEITSKAQIRELQGLELDVSRGHGLKFDARVTSAQLDDLRARGFQTRVLDEDVYEDAGGLRGSGFLPEYVSYSEAVDQLNAYASTYPALTALTSLGTSHEGRTLWALKISDNASIDEDEPEVLIAGNHHAREVITVMIPLAIADSLLSHYGSDPQYTDWVNERETWIVPVVNPDGLVYVQTTDLFWRKNRWVDPQTLITYGVDLNRNYAYEWGHDNNGSSPSKSNPLYRGPSAASEPEVQAIQNFVDARDFSFTISYHSYGNLTLWVPGWKPALPEDQDLFAEFGDIVASQNGYTPGNPAMGAIYITNGDTDDWIYHSASHPKIYGLTPEVGTGSDYFNPPANRLATLVDEGQVAAWTAIEYADRPEQLAPPGLPTMNPITTRAAGDYDVTWNGPTTADTEVAAYELTEKQGPAVATDGAESGSGSWSLGGWSTSSAREYAGAFSFYSGSGNELNRIMLAKEGYEVQLGDSFTFRAWYDIESNWDYAYALLSTDGGRSFVNLAGTGTTMSDPNGNNADNGITGSSGGWQLMTFDLSAWAGQTVWLGFRYYTDAGVVDEGIYVDEIHPVQTWTTSTVLSSAIVGTSYSVTGRPEGTYWYSVRGRDAEGDWGYPSAGTSVTVVPSTDIATIGERPVFSLAGNIPNPFGARTARTKIRFSLPAAGDHSLLVYDVAGRRVRALSRGFAAAGPHEVAWDGRNDDGQVVPSGVYFYALKTGAGELRERAVLRR